MEVLICLVHLGKPMVKTLYEYADKLNNISAMDSGAGSLAIGELIGAAFFIVAIVSAWELLNHFNPKRSLLCGMHLF
jgi:hypothetical protein